MSVIEKFNDILPWDQKIFLKGLDLDIVDNFDDIMYLDISGTMQEEDVSIDRLPKNLVWLDARYNELNLCVKKLPE